MVEPETLKLKQLQMVKRLQNQVQNLQKREQKLPATLSLAGTLLQMKEKHFLKLHLILQKPKSQKIQFCMRVGKQQLQEKLLK